MVTQQDIHNNIVENATDLQKRYLSMQCGNDVEKIKEVEKSMANIVNGVVSVLRNAGTDYLNEKIRGYFMKVIIGQSAYEMTAQQLSGVLKVASKQVPFGIYAVKKGRICELHNDKFDSKEDLLAEVARYSQKGFKVYYNAP